MPRRQGIHGPPGQGTQGEPCGCVGRCGTHWTDEQIISLIISGGFQTHSFTTDGSGRTLNAADTKNVVTALAIALCESGGYAQACNRNSNGSIDRGLWQINSLWGNLSRYDHAEQAMWTVWGRSGRSFKAWNGDLARRAMFMPRALKSVADYARKHGGLLGDPGEVSGDLGSLLGGGGDCGACLHCWNAPFGFHVCFDTILGGFKVAAGGGIVGLAGLSVLYLLGRELGAPSAARAVAATPIGRTYKTVKRRAPAEARQRVRAVKRAPAQAERYRSRVAPKPERPEVPARGRTQDMSPAQKRELVRQMNERGARAGRTAEG